MTYEYSEWTQPPIDPVQLKDEIDLMHIDMQDVMRRLAGLGATIDMSLSGLATQVDVLRVMLFENGPLAGRFDEFKWMNNRRLLELATGFLSQATKAKLIAPHKFQP